MLILATVLIISDTIHTATVAAGNLPSPVNQLQNTSTIQSTTVITPTNCRYGVSSWDNDDFNFLQDLGVGWALNFNVNFNQNLPDGVEYTPMIRFKPDLDGDGKRTGDYLIVSKPFSKDNPGNFDDEPNELDPIIAANPGRLWIIGNEVDRVTYQDNLMPDVYATAYHDAYHFIKERDPSAQIAVSGLVQVTPGRLQYLDLVWNSYLEKYGTTMPVDVWNMHLYILAERHPDGGDIGAAIALGTDPNLAIWSSDNNAALCANDDVYCHAEHDDMTIFAEQVVAMRQWMKAHGQQNKPLILSEYSLLYQYDQEGDSDPNTCYLRDEYGHCFTPERVSEFMVNSFDYLRTTTNTNLGFPADNYRLVQQWLWYSTYAKENFASNLLTGTYTLDNYTLRLPGVTFQTEMNELRPFTTNPYINEVSYPTATTITPTGTTSITVGATIYNNGDTVTTTPITVTFYADANKTDEIGTAVIPAGLSGCARRTGQAEVVWHDLSTGLHPYWAEAEGGNTVEGFVIINPEQIYLPISLR
jgi:hypothetical protein